MSEPLAETLEQRVERVVKSLDKVMRPLDDRQAARTSIMEQAKALSALAIQHNLPDLINADMLANITVQAREFEVKRPILFADIRTHRGVITPASQQECEEREQALKQALDDAETFMSALAKAEKPSNVAAVQVAMTPEQQVQEAMTGRR